jgi:hypothetical protein
MPARELRSPRERIAAECEKRGRDAVVSGCISLLTGGEADRGLYLALAGAHGDFVLDGHEGGKEGYWPRVWAARGLLHVWDDRAIEALVSATRDPSWRVREMAAKVVARHRVDDALEAMALLQDDEVARVRGAALRALAALSNVQG